jgi:hypothetical protein
LFGKRALAVSRRTAEFHLQPDVVAVADQMLVGITTITAATK